MSAKYFVIAVMLLNFAFQACLYIINEKQRKKPLPENVKDVYDGERYKKWSSYARESNFVSLVSDVVSLVFLCILILTDAFSWFGSLMPSNVYLNTICLSGTYILLSSLVTVPLDYVSDVKIEKKYDMGTTKLSTFVIDKIKSLIVSLLLECGLICLCIFLYTRLGMLFFIAAYAVVLVFVVLFSTFSLTFQKLFNKFTPLEDGELRTRLAEMFEKEGYKLRQIYVMNASLRTNKVNAFCTGLGKFKEIVLYDNLVNNYSDDEIVAVFAHELQHFKKKDTTLLTAMSSLSLLPVMLLMLALVYAPGFSKAFGFAGVNFSMVFIAMGALLEPITTITSIPINAVSRSFEYRADAYAKSIGSGKALVSALKKISSDNLGNLNPHPLIVFVEHNHPTLSQRISRLEQK